jgi:hypothetical protein
LAGASHVSQPGCADKYSNSNTDKNTRADSDDHTDKYGDEHTDDHTDKYGDRHANAVSTEDGKPLFTTSFS